MDTAEMVASIFLKNNYYFIKKVALKFGDLKKMCYLCIKEITITTKTLQL